MRVIGLLGYAGSGKDTAADAICRLSKHVRRGAFADSLREEVASAFCVSPELLVDRETKQKPTDALRLSKCSDDKFFGFILRQPIEYTERYNCSPRVTMQMWGDYRRSTDPDYFVKKLREKIHAVPPTTEVFVVSDVRYNNERHMIRQFGDPLLIWVHRPEVGPVNGHSSELALGPSDADVVLVNNGGIDDLFRAVQALVA